MPYPRTFLRHTLLWTLPDGEVASCRIHWDSDASFPLPFNDTLVDAFADKWLDNWAFFKDQYVAGVGTIGSKLSLIGTDGLVDATSERIVAAVPGVASGSALPTEVAVCVSLRTSSAARSGRGRAYLPNPAVSKVTTAGRLDATSLADLLSGFGGYMDSFTVGTDEYWPVVASATLQELQRIQSIRVGDVFDVQRRRRDAIQEAYSIRALT